MAIAVTANDIVFIFWLARGLCLGGISIFLLTARGIIVNHLRITVSAMPPISRNCQNAYFISFSKELDGLQGQAPVVASREPCVNRGLGGSN
jgi:hypothetical protein